MTEITYNFGAIRDSVMKLSAAEILKESKSQTLDKFTSFIKNSPVLNKQHLVFKSLQECKPFEKPRLAERFLNQHLQLFANEKWENIMAENKKIRRELLDDMHVEAKKDGALFEAISKLLEFLTRKDFKDFEGEQKAYEFVMEHLTRKPAASEDNSSEKNDSPQMMKEAWKFITKMAINNFNERFKHLSESEKKAFKILVSDNATKENYLEAIRNENITIINSKLQEEKNQDNKNILNSFKEKLEKLQGVSHDKLDESIIACLELKDNLSTTKISE